MTVKRTAIQIRDPFILPLPAAGRYVLFGTTNKNAWNGPGHGFDCYTSGDLETWEGPLPAFRPPPGFWSNTQYWAPECHAWRGRYFLFASFSRDERGRGTQILVADRPEGPYRPHSDGPVTPRAWECLDGTLWADDTGRPWLVFCHEWVQVTDGTICALPLRDDLSAAAGEPTLLFAGSAAVWAKPYESHGRQGNYVTDGPFLYRGAGGRLFMLWSTLGYEGYALGYAVSPSGNVLGPWQQTPTPLFTQDGGHGMLFRTFAGQLMLTLHAPNRTPHERPHFFAVEEARGELRLKA